MDSKETLDLMSAAHDRALAIALSIIRDRDRLAAQSVELQERIAKAAQHIDEGITKQREPYTILDAVQAILQPEEAKG